MKAMKIMLAGAALATASGALAYEAGTTRDQTIASVAKKYQKMNADNKGEVSAAELGAFMTASSAKRGEPADQAKIARRLTRLDTDGNGSVSQAELQVEELEKFDKADADKNGKIDAAEAQ